MKKSVANTTTNATLKLKRKKGNKVKIAKTFSGNTKDYSVKEPIHVKIQMVWDAIDAINEKMSLMITGDNEKETPKVNETIRVRIAKQISSS